MFHTDRSDPLLTAPPLIDAAGGGVWLAPLDGAETEDKPFRDALAKALARREVPAGVESAGPRGAKLFGAAAPATHEGGGYVDVWWRLEGPDGALRDAFSVRAPLDFRVERPETKVAIDEVAARVADMLGPPPVEKAVARAIPFAAPPAETEGFEDGRPLARAMAAALGLRGLQPSEDKDAVAFVRAKASVEPATEAKGVVRVKIRWAVETRDGTEVGAADQQNLLPEAAAVDGLAPIAAEAAAAAAPAVAGLIRIAAKIAAEADAAAPVDGAADAGEKQGGPKPAGAL